MGRCVACLADGFCVCETCDESSRRPCLELSLYAVTLSGTQQWVHLMNMFLENRCSRLTGACLTANAFKGFLIAFVFAFSGLSGPGGANAALDAALIRNAVVFIEADVPSDAFTADVLGTEREGSGVVIGDEGLILTIGYVMLEASRVIVTDSEGRQFPADPLAYDFETGFGLVRALPPFAAAPVTLGDSDGIDLDDPLLALAAGEPMKTTLVARRTYAGYWEYLLEDALFTAPPHSNFGGAALFDRRGDLIGIGSLNLPDHVGDGSGDPANMFVPVNALKPILDDLITTGRRAGPPRPWLGFYPRELRQRLYISRVAPGSPADESGLEQGDQIVSIDSVPVSSLETLYETLWDLGISGVIVPLEIVRKGRPVTLKIKSSDRYRFLKLRQTY